MIKTKINSKSVKKVRRLVKSASQVSNDKNKTCPNCGHNSLRKFMDMWLCHECEYHAKSLKKKARGSFR